MLKLWPFQKFLEVMATAMNIHVCTIYICTQKYAKHKYTLTHAGK